MFGKLKDSLKGWFKKSKKKIEEESELVETEETTEDIDEEIKEKKEELEKIEETGEILKEEEGKKASVKEVKEEVKEVVEEKVKEIPQEEVRDVEGARKEVEETQKIAGEIEKKIEEADELIELAKEEEIPEAPLKFEVGKQKFEPDLERIKEEKAEENGGPVEKEKKGIFSKFKSRFAYKIREEEFNDIFDDLEMSLLENNVALEAVESIRENLKDKLVGKEIKKDKLEEEISEELKNSLNEILIEPDNPLDFIKIADKPFKILFFGINGTGKTTTIAKITSYLKKAGFSVVLAAGDTFRAASIEQISEHAKNLGVPVIKHDYGGDPSAVGFDAIKYAEKNKIDVVLIDTAGRMHTQSNLISEMEKIVRVTKPDLKLFVAESIAGNDAIEQAKTFNEAISIDGSVLSKVDIDEKGGTIISISHATGKPIFYLGTGQNYEDLELFNKQKFIESLGL